MKRGAFLILLILLVMQGVGYCNFTLTPAPPGQTQWDKMNQQTAADQFIDSIFKAITKKFAGFGTMLCGVFIVLVIGFGAYFVKLQPYSSMCLLTSILGAVLIFITYCITVFKPAA